MFWPMSWTRRCGVPLRHAFAFLVSVGAIVALSTDANAALSRGGGGTTNDGQGEEYGYYITPTLETAPEPIAGRDQAWLLNPTFLPTPSGLQPDGSEPCYALAVVFCAYSVGPGESRLLDVVATVDAAIGERVSDGTLQKPLLSITWTVSNAGASRSFTFSGLDAFAFSYPAKLNLTGLPAGDYRIVATYEYTLPAGYSFYKDTPFVLNADVRAVNPDPLGTTLSIAVATRLTIDAASVGIDSTPPTTTASVSPAANASGWITSNPTFTLTAVDPAGTFADEPVSGVEYVGYFGTNAANVAVGDTSPTSPLSVGFVGDGAYGFLYGATDKAGNTEEPKTFTFRVDATPPTIGASVSPAANASGWRNATTSVTFVCSDATSGVSSCGPSVPGLGNGADQVVTGTAVDTAGNVTTTSVTVSVDTIAPTIGASRSPAANAAGWNSTPVTVSFTCSDTPSGIASCTEPTTLAANGSNQSAQGTAVDVAGNSAVATLSGVKIDTVAPSVTVTGVAEGSSYAPGSVPAAGCATTDALSGVQTQATPSTTGPANGIGEFTVTCSGATDVAGNAAAARSVKYRVAYSFAGFYSPVDNAPVFNRTNAGQAVPVKFGLGGDYGLNILAAGAPSSRPMSCSSQLVADVESLAAASAPTLTYDAASNTYTYVWKTSKSFAGTCRQFELTLNDGTTRVAYFRFR